MKPNFLQACGRTLLVLVGLLAARAGAQAQNIGIGTTTPTQTLDVNGGLRVRALGSGGARLLATQADGTLTTGNPLSPTSGLGAGSQFLTSISVPAGTNTYYTIESADNYLYLLGSADLRVYDATNPTRPVPTGSPVVLRPNQAQLTVGGGYAYVVTTSNTIDVYQLPTPTTFTYLRTVTAAPAGAINVGVEDLLVVGNYLYVIIHYNVSGSGNTNNSMLQTYDLSNRATPVLLNTLVIPRSTSQFSTLAVNAARNSLCVYVSNADFVSYSLATSSSPTTQVAAGTRSLLPSYSTNAVGGVLYSAGLGSTAGTTQFQSFDISTNSVMPTQLSSVTLPYTIYSFAILGRYAYLISTDPLSSGAPAQLYIALVAAPSFLGFDASGNLTSVAPVLPTGDNLGNHTAAQNLNLASYQLVGNGGSQGVSISSSGQVGIGIGTTTPGAALDVNGAARTTDLTATGNVQAATVTATTSVQTSAVQTPATGTHNMLVLAYGAVGSGGNFFGSTDNIGVSHSSAGTYRITFNTASGLSATSLSSAVVSVTLYGVTPGFASYATTTAGAIDITTSTTNAVATDRGFSFTVYRP